MKKEPFFNYGPMQVTRLVLFGSLVISVVLTLLLIIYDIAYAHQFRVRTVIGLCTISYLVVCWVFLRTGRLSVVKWLLLVLYSGIAFSSLLYWGINTASAIFATSFVIVLSGILLGSKAILPITLYMTTLLFIVQTFHSLSIITPDISSINKNTNYLDAISFATILAAFALVTWIFNNQTEKSLYRARRAEKKLRAQKESITSELEKESARLRHAQLKEIEQLYKFATLGQSTAATLHELSNHLSILNMDIDDLKQQHQNSKAIKNAQDSIDQLNLTLKQIRRKLNSYQEDKIFKISSVINQLAKDNRESFKSKQVNLICKVLDDNASIQGDPTALIQVLTILINNALEACYELPNARVILNVIHDKKNVLITITDNGMGVDESKRTSLFLPMQSSKANGLGVGLYIAKHITESQLNGTIYYKDQDVGSAFTIKLPVKASN